MVGSSKRELGQNLAEVGLVCGLVIIVTIGTITQGGNTVNAIFSNINGNMRGALTQVSQNTTDVTGSTGTVTGMEVTFPFSNNSPEENQTDNSPNGLLLNPSNNTNNSLSIGQSIDSSAETNGGNGGFTELNTDNANNQTPKNDPPKVADPKNDNNNPLG